MYSLKNSKFGMHECCTRCITLPSRNCDLFPPLTFSFVPFLAYPEHNFVVLSRNDLKHGMSVCCNIGDLVFLGLFQSPT